jgi:hypothetical protein
MSEVKRKHPTRKVTRWKKKMAEIKRRQTRKVAHSKKVREAGQLLVFVGEDAELCHFILVRKSAVSKSVWTFLSRGIPTDGSFEPGHVPQDVIEWYESTRATERPEVTGTDGSATVPPDVNIGCVRIFRTFC